MENPWEKIESWEGPEALEQEAEDARFETLQQYLEALIVTHQHDRIMPVLFQVARLMDDGEPEADLSLPALESGVIKEVVFGVVSRPASTAFFMGGVVGVRMAHGFLPPDLYNAMPHLETAAEPILNEVEEPEVRAVIKQEIIEASIHGFNLVPDYEALIQKWANGFATEEERDYFCSGFGFVMELINEVWDDPVQNVRTRIDQAEVRPWLKPSLDVGEPEEE